MGGANIPSSAFNILRFSETFAVSSPVFDDRFNELYGAGLMPPMQVVNAWLRPFILLRRGDLKNCGGGFLSGPNAEQELLPPESEQSC